MSSVITGVIGGATLGDGVAVVYVPEQLAHPAAIRLAVAVIWRAAPGVDPQSPVWPHVRTPLAWLRRLRHRLWMRFGPLGMDVRLGRTRRDGGSVGVGLSRQGEEVGYYDEERRLVRLLDRVCKLPRDGRTLVVLVDEEPERGRAGSRPRIALRTVLVSVPLARPPTPENPALGREAAASRRAAATAEAHASWMAALRADPGVRAFLNGGASADP